MTVGSADVRYGLRNSSRTRVGPVFARLLMRDPTARTWLPRLLELPQRPDAPGRSLPTHVGSIIRCAWEPQEQSLAPPPSLLEYLRANPQTDVASELLASLSEERRATYVFEGLTSVDAYIETDALLVVVEGKRTESGPTTHTKWMPTRHQMLRNLDAAWEIREGRAVVGFFIVEGDKSTGELTEPWKRFVERTVSPDALERSLPHRTRDEQRAIGTAFLGATTWQIVCSHFGIDFGALPDQVEIRYLDPKTTHPERIVARGPK